MHPLHYSKIRNINHEQKCLINSVDEEYPLPMYLVNSFGNLKSENVALHISSGQYLWLLLTSWVRISVRKLYFQEIHFYYCLNHPQSLELLWELLFLVSVFSYCFQLLWKHTCKENDSTKLHKYTPALESETLITRATFFYTFHYNMKLCFLVHDLCYKKVATAIV